MVLVGRKVAGGQPSSLQALLIFGPRCVRRLVIGPQLILSDSKSMEYSLGIIVGGDVFIFIYIYIFLQKKTVFFALGT